MEFMEFSSYEECRIIDIIWNGEWCFKVFWSLEDGEVKF